jgi:hypothetical protein
VTRQAKDVAALVLTLGEPTTRNAIASLQRQTLTPRDVVQIRDVRPFHAALNCGVAQVKADFFVQVDADMILDSDCIRTMREAVGSDTGIVVAHLRDVLIGEVVGVKLFRTRCFRQVKMPDSISPDTDFGRQIAELGWKTVYVGIEGADDEKEIVTLGEHRADYTPKYTYGKYLLEGLRYSYRRSAGGLLWHFRRLESSRHPSALIAQIGLAQGIFLGQSIDLLGLDHTPSGFDAVDRFLMGGSAVRATPVLLSETGGMAETFRACFVLGRELFCANDGFTFKEFLVRRTVGRDPRRLVAKVGLCAGLVANSSDEAEISSRFAVLSEFLVGGERKRRWPSLFRLLKSTQSWAQRIISDRHSFA